MAASAHHPPRAGHGYASNLQNTRAAQVRRARWARRSSSLTSQLATAYQQLAKELSSDKIKVVGAYTLGKVIGEGA